MTRAEHMQWCKERAMQYADAGDLTSALASMLSDLEKHPETSIAGNAGMNSLVMLAMQQTMAGDHRGVVRFIQGFN